MLMLGGRGVRLSGSGLCFVGGIGRIVWRVNRPCCVCVNGGWEVGFGIVGGFYVLSLSISGSQPSSGGGGGCTTFLIPLSPSFSG